MEPNRMQRYEPPDVTAAEHAELPNSQRPQEPNFPNSAATNQENGGGEPPSGGEAPAGEKEPTPHHNPYKKKPPVPTRFLKKEVGISGDTPSTVAPTDLLVKLFCYFFNDALLGHVVTCTNEDATQTTVTVKDEGTGRITYKGPPRNAAEESASRNRCAKWRDLSVPELLVFLGVVIKMAVVNHKRIYHFWVEGKAGFGDEMIRSAMRESRFLEVLANLAFMRVGDESYPGDRLRKIRWVRDHFLDRARKAYNPEKNAWLDESKLCAVTPWCPFKCANTNRQIFFWHLLNYGFRDVQALWEEILGDEVIKRLKRENHSFGYSNWVQYELGHGIIRYGLERAKQDAFDAHPDEEYAPRLHFVPSKKRLVRPVEICPPVPESHALTHINEIKVWDKNRNQKALPRGMCRVCMTKASRANGNYVLPDGRPCPKPRTGCNKCKVCLCKDCFKDFDHKQKKVRSACVMVS